MNTAKLKYLIYSLSIPVISVNICLQVAAQIVPDNTLGAESSIVNQLEILKQQIEGGAIRGENLFHSFTEFNVGNGESVYFVNPQGINNILTRVTGNNITKILGVLGINGNGNLFLLNPNGFFFGENASLDLNGSFLATTGDIHSDEGFFSATNIEGSRLFSVKPEALFTNAQHKIENRANLMVKEGNKIILIAEKVNNIGNLTAPKGEIILQGNKVNLTENSQVDVSANDGAGEIKIQGQEEINIRENVSLKADALLMGDGGKIELISSGKIEFLGNISARGENAGEVIIEGAEVINNGEIDLGPENSENQENTIALEDDKTENTIALESQTSENNVGANAISPNNAQITAANPRLEADTTLGNENSQIETIDENNDRVISGAERGANLFHSFGEFNIETGKGVYFANPEGINNILARVTGNNISEIRGTLGVEGSADLYFINPNGLFFNQNASLDLNGSFFASTAEAIIFNEFEYSAVNPNIPPNLQISVPTGLRFGDNPRDIILKNEETIVQEQGDAGELLDTAQSVNENNTSVPNAIQGDLTGGNDADLYQVSLEADKPFSATTVGGSNVDTRLFLFDNQGLGIDANEDDSPVILQSTLSEFTPTESGVYYLGISSYENAPESVDGEIFTFNPNTFQFEGLGVGGNSPLSGWNQLGAGDGGGYVISLSSGNETTPTGNLAVNQGQTLALIGGNVTVEGVEIISPSSNIILGGLNQAGIVNINPDLSLSFPQGINRGDVSLINSTVLDVAGNDGGSITLNAQNIDINKSNVLAGIREGLGFEGAQAGDIKLDAQDIVIENGSVRNDIVGTGNSDGIKIETGTLELTNGGFILASTFGTGDAGLLQVNASGGIALGGSFIVSQIGTGAVGNIEGIVIDTTTLSLSNGGQIFAGTFGEGDVGLVQIKASEGITLDGSGILSQVRADAVGNSEGIIIDTTTLSLTNGGEINAITFGEGNAGLLQIKASEGITLDGTSIFSQVSTDAVGNSEGIIIDTTTLSLSNGGQIAASTFGKGDGGFVQIKASEGITLDGTSIFSQVGTDAVGNSRGIIIDTSLLSLTNGANLSTSTLGEGNAGGIMIKANNSVVFDGENSNGEPSGVFSEVKEDALGNAGNITIETGSLFLTNGAVLTVNTLGQGDAGIINITASDKVVFDGEKSDGNPSAVSSVIQESAIGKIGRITINTGSLEVNNGASLDLRIVGTALDKDNSENQNDLGKIIINARDIVRFDGTRSNGNPSSASTQVETPNSKGDVKGIEITTGSLFVTNGAVLDANTNGNGNAGNIKINAREIVEFDGLREATDEEKIQGIKFVSSGLSSAVEAQGRGKAGDIDITTGSLFVTGGAALNARTSGEGKAGTITIDAKEKIVVEGEGTVNFDGEILVVPSAVSSEVAEGAIGDAGDIMIKTPQLTITAGANISAFTSSQGDGGDISIDAPDFVTIGANSELNVETSAVGKPGNITITSPTVTIGEDARISATATATSTNTEGGGSITLNVSNLNLSGQLGIFAETQGQSPAGNLFIQPNNDQSNLNIVFTDNGLISVRTNAGGEGGSITIKAPENIDIRGNGSITAETSGSGNAGNIDIDTQNLMIADNVTITTSTESSGNAGLITLNADESIFFTNEVKITSEVIKGAKGTSEGIVINTPILSISDRSQISAATEGEGEAGDITIDATNSVTIDDNSLLNVQTDSIGKAGNIDITTNTLTIGEDSELSAKTTVNATGDAGRIDIFANILDITGELGIFAETEGEADAGSLNINPNDNSNLAITFFDEGQISAATRNAGNGGDINIKAPQTIDIQGNGTIKVETTGSGEAGDINFTSQQLNISEGVTISALTSGEGEAGSINLNIGEEILINSGTTFTVETDGKEDAGDIKLTANKITIGDNAELSARSKENASGKAGDIILNTNQLIVFGDKGIFAETLGEGEGGKITIQPPENNLFLEINFFNDGKISASTSGSGKGGDININAPENINISGNGIIKVETNGSGDAGSILIESHEINLTDSIEISASTSNLGNSKNITLKGNLINLENATIKALTTGEGNPGSILISNRENNNANQVNLTNNSTISTEIKAEGDRENALPADITINTNNLSLDSSKITASTSANRDAGEINFNANNINLNNSQIEAFTTSSGEGGNINIPNSENLNLVNNSEISASTSGEGEAGSIDLNVNQAVSIDSGSQLKVETESIGDAGDIEIDTPILTIGENAELSAISKNTATGIAGNITLNTNQLNISGELGIFAETEGEGDAGILTINPLQDNPHLTISFRNQGNISASTLGSGDGGDIEITAPEAINIRGDGIISVLTSGSGIAGTISIESQNITLTEGIEINASTSTSGDSGNINLLADNINLDNALIQAITSSSGKGGNINIPDAENLNLVNNSEISASTSGEGEAGSIDLNVNQAVSIDSGSQLKVETESIGDAGDIEIDTPILTIGENAELSARSKNTATGIAGKITLNTNQLNISGELGIFAETEGVADAGNLTINPLDNNPNLTISFSRQGNISASTFGSGNGGDININADENISISGDGIISVLTKGSGKAGTINIDTQNLSLTNGIEINASTLAEGKAGNINLSAININLSQGEVNAVTNSTGNAGDINLIGDNINLDNTTIQAFTTAEGNPGSILINNGDNNANQVKLTNNSTISTEIQAEGDRENAQPAANITINSDNLSLDSSTITASTTANRDGGKIEILDSEKINLTNQSEITAFTSGSGKAGNIDLNVETEIKIESGSKLNVETNSSGIAGNIDITTNTLTIGEESELTAKTTENASGKAGNITINANLLHIKGELGIFAETEGEADAGNLKINPDDNSNLAITFFDEGQISASTSGSGKGGNIEITAPSIINISGDGIIKVETNGSGDAGSILIESHEINLTDSIEISASTSNRGNSGDITLEGNLINLDDATIKALTEGEGNPGSIFISNGENNANQVNLTNSTISTEIKAEGNRESAQPANITINSDNLFLQSSQITASTNSNRDAGNINITSENLNLVNNSEINTLSQGKGDAGDINLDVNGLFTATDGNISANANQAGGGKITINAQNIRLRGDSDIRTNVNSGAGDGGNITITADSIINFDDSDIFAFARDGRGGNISLNTPVFLGDGYQPGDSDSVNDPNILDGNGKVDINATGAVSGVILIPDTTFIQKGLVQLPESFIDPESLIANTCIVPHSRQQGTFIIKGAGGLPISPGKPYISPYPTGTVQPLPDSQPDTINDHQSRQKGEPIIQPQSILKNTEGKLILTRQCP